MGESTVYAHAPINEDKMGSVNRGDLEVSISFGRFENDSLSWEKWSSFSQNKYLEEVEKCSTPGSVAMKKAYFEAHYKKIAAKKLMEDQQAQMEADPLLRSDEPNVKADLELQASNDQCFAEEIIEETSLISEESGTSVDEQKEDTATSIECQFVEEMKISTSRPDIPCLRELEEVILVKEDTPSMIKEKEKVLIGKPDSPCLRELEEVILVKEEDVLISIPNSPYLREPEEVIFVKEEEKKLISRPNSPCLRELEEVILVKEEEVLISRPNSPCLREPEEVILVKEGNPSLDIQDATEISQDLDNEMMKKKPVLKIKKEIVRQSLPKKPIKKTITSKERNMAKAQKAPVSSSPIQKTPQLFTPRVSKPTSLTSTMVSSSSRSSTKKGVNSSFQRSNNSSTGEKKRAIPSSLHMSLNLDLKKSDSAPSGTTRKSLIMEQMGDKDIVKRAFKTFQIKEENSPLLNPVPRRGNDLKVSSSVTPRKDKERSHKTASVKGKGSKPISSSSVLRSGDKTETRKKSLKKLDDNSTAKEANNTQISSKAKEQKETEIKKMRQSLNFKATPLPGFYRGQQLSKSLLDKGNSRNGTLN